MISPDLLDCSYTAEVLRTRAGSPEVAEQILEVTTGPRARDTMATEADAISVFHGFTPSPKIHHRTLRRKAGSDGDLIVPRQKVVAGRERFIYDVLIAQRARHTILAVPFHNLAEELFPRVDRVLAGSRTAYERLNITNIVLALGRNGRIAVEDSDEGAVEIGLTRCHLAYSDAANRSRDIQSIQMAGTNLGTTREYRFLIAPVLDRPDAGLRVIPLILGFSLYVGGVRKASAVTDRHGNFKVFVGPGLRQLVRLLDLLDVLSTLEDVVSPTANLPILQSRGIASETSE